LKFLTNGTSLAAQDIVGELQFRRRLHPARQQAGRRALPAIAGQPDRADPSRLVGNGLFEACGQKRI